VREDQTAGLGALCRIGAVPGALDFRSDDSGIHRHHAGLDDAGQGDFLRGLGAVPEASITVKTL